MREVRADMKETYIIARFGWACGLELVIFAAIAWFVRWLRRNG